MAMAIPLKRFSRRLLSYISFYSGYCLLLEYFKINVGSRILCFHGINENPTSQYAVSATNFAAQMRFLVENYVIVSIEQLVKLLQDIKPISSNIIALSIDDGFQDFYTYGFPVLKHYAIPATVFIPTGFIGNKLKYEKKKVLPQSEFLSWDEIREMNRCGIEFGSHSVSHKSLTKLTQPELRYELEHSKSMMETEIGKEITGFAYPYGTFRDVSPSIEQLLTASGYSWAVTSNSGINKHGSNKFALRRTVIELDDGINGFKRALRGSLDPWIIMQKIGRYL
jgi:peptidoglycan/xylan/chitin deacetylase (PgdA/CDA1 family)